MTKSQAIYVKYCRVRCENSWRIVHSNYQKRYIPKEDWYVNPVHLEFKLSVINESKLNGKYLDKLRDTLFNFPDGNQITGRELCRQAQDLLKENWEDEC